MVKILDKEHLHSSRKFLCTPLKSSLSSYPQTVATTKLLNDSKILPCLECFINGMTQQVVIFCVIWYCTFQIFPHCCEHQFFVLLSSISLFYNNRLLIHSTIDGQVDCFQFMIFMSKIYMNIGVQICWNIYFNFLGYICSNEIC